MSNIEQVFEQSLQGKTKELQEKIDTLENEIEELHEIMHRKFEAERSKVSFMMNKIVEADNRLHENATKIFKLLDKRISRNDVSLMVVGILTLINSALIIARIMQ